MLTNRASSKNNFQNFRIDKKNGRKVNAKEDSRKIKKIVEETSD
jgi:hypothetical protein